jgi:hypothetical protein
LAMSSAGLITGRVFLQVMDPFRPSALLSL